MARFLPDDRSPEAGSAARDRVPGKTWPFVEIAVILGVNPA